MIGNKPFPMALEAPADPLVKMDDALIAQAIEQSRQSPRKRIILPLHKTPAALLQRMLGVYPFGHVAEHLQFGDGAVGVLDPTLVGSVMHPDAVRLVELGNPERGRDVHGIDLRHEVAVGENHHSKLAQRNHHGQRKSQQLDQGSLTEVTRE